MNLYTKKFMSQEECLNFILNNRWMSNFKISELRTYNNPSHQNPHWIGVLVYWADWELQ